MYALFIVHPDLVLYCLQKGSDVNQRQGRTLYIVLSAHTTLVLIIFAGFNTPLNMICQKPNCNEDDQLLCVQYLIQYGSSVDNTDKNGNSSLILSAKQNRSSIVSYLLKSGADINKQNKHGMTVSLNKTC